MATQPHPQLRKTGIGVVGDVPWGAHFFMFYDSKEDLLDTLVPYFKTGLENGEACLWLVSDPLTQEEARNTLGKAMPDFDQYLADGRIEIADERQFYFSGDDLDLQRTIRIWAEKTDFALKRGCAGLRLSASTAWLEKQQWKAFSEYESEVTRSLSRRRMMALCTYPLAGTTAAEILDVTRTHQFAIARRNRGWEVVETSELKQAKSEIKRLNDELERRVAERTVQLEAVNQALRKEIAERQRAEQNVRRSEDHLRLVIDTIPQQIWSGPADGSLDFCNAQWLSYLGLTQQEAQGKGWQVVLHPDDRERVLTAWAESVAEGTPYEQEERHRRADGQYRWFLSRGLPLKDAEGCISRWYGTNTDIEERRHAEDALFEAQVNLARVSRVQAMAELAAAIGHEINQPLTAIVTNANFSLRQLSGSLPDLDELRAAIVEIVDDSTRASSVVSRIRGLLVDRTLGRTTLDINEIIKDITAILRHELNRNRVSLRTELATDLPRVSGDKVQLQQVLINLVINAIEAMRTSTQPSRTLLIRSIRKPSENLVQVQDSGPGISPEEAGRIFEPFFTTKAEGTGMGLSICNSIVESHGGRLWTEPNSSGALFQFTLPTSDASAS
jgi:PAS domain S-box-containing protein